MADNTQINLSTVPGGDFIRDIVRGSGVVKTQVVQFDIGGAASNAEVLLTAGQQLMAASLPVTIAADQAPITILRAPGTTKWGQVTGVLTATTVTVVSIASSVADYQIKGMVAHGTGDGYFTILVNGVILITTRTRLTAPLMVLPLPNGIAVPTGSLIQITVLNESATTASFDVTLLGA